MMTIRMKERYWKGFTKNKKYNPKERVIPGAAGAYHSKPLYGKISNEEFERRQIDMYKANRTAPNRSELFMSRIKLHESLIHRGYQHGIFGDEGVGTYSVVLSNRYEDNDDQGISVLFTMKAALIAAEKASRPVRAQVFISFPTIPEHERC